MDKQMMAELVLGTYEHDLFKPFWLPNRDHALLGYEFQRNIKGASAFRSAAVLFHSFSYRNRNQFNDNINRCRQDGIDPAVLPKALLVAPHLDLIASASYSMLEDYSAYQGWPGAVQNVFSRLPIRQARTHLLLSMDNSRPSGGQYGEQLFRQPFIASFSTEAIRTQFAEATVEGGADFIERSKRTAAVMQQHMSELSQAQIDFVQGIYSTFAERTYPSPNDTTLTLHTRLAANLYHVVLANLATAPDLDGMGLETITDHQFSAWSRAISVRTLLEASTITIHLAGIEERFLSAVRLDDLQGAKLLAERVRYALKRRVCAELFGFQALSEEMSCDGHPLADLLCLSEDRFSLTYLVPATCGDPARLLAILYRLYQFSLEDVIDLPGPAWEGEKYDGEMNSQPLLKHLTADIRRTLQDASIVNAQIYEDLTPSRTTLLEGLRVLLPAINQAQVQPVLLNHGAWQPEDFGRALVSAYRQVRAGLRNGQAPPEAVAELAAASDKEEKEHIPICSASNASPAWTILADYAYGRNGKQRLEALQQYFHDFRTEQEELSQASVALRALAHGVAEAALLRQFVRAQAPTPDAKGAYQLVYQAAQVGQQPLALPPFLERRSEICRQSGMVDLNGAYVRVRREGAAHGDPLIRFPSVSYAADRMGNVAMLTLRPTTALYKPQPIDRAFMDQVLQGESTWTPLQAYHDLRTYYFHADGQVDPSLRQELLTIPAHLARVLQRQQTITTFFERLPLRLEAAGVRVLILEERFPVGRYLLPADQLTTALDVLDLALCLDLLAVHARDLGLNDTQAMTEIDSYHVLAPKMTAEQAETRQQLHTFLAGYVPEVLVGTTMLFKHKQALYLMLRAEERLHHAIKPKPVLAMGFTDLRGTLIDRGELQGEFAFAEWAEILTATRQLDRRSLDGLAHDRLTVERLAKLNPPTTPALQEALEEWVAARWINRLSGADVKKRVKRKLWALGEAEAQAEARVKVVHFLARATRG